MIKSHVIEMVILTLRLGVKEGNWSTSPGDEDFPFPSGMPSAILKQAVESQQFHHFHYTGSWRKLLLSLLVSSKPFPGFQLLFTCRHPQQWTSVLLSPFRKLVKTLISLKWYCIFQTVLMDPVCRKYICDAWQHIWFCCSGWKAIMTHCLLHLIYIDIKVSVKISEGGLASFQNNYHQIHQN